MTEENPAPSQSEEPTQNQVETPTPSPSGLLGEESISSTPTTQQANLVDADGNFTEGWQDRMDGFEDSKQILSQFKNVEGVFKTLVSQQRLLGKKAEAVLIPGEDTAPEERAAFYEKLGVPKNSSDYESRPSLVPKDFSWDESVAKEVNEIAHEHGVTPKALEALMGKYIELESSRDQQSGEESNRQMEEDRKSIANEWGDNFEANKARVLRLWKFAGEDPQDPALNSPNVVRALSRIAEGLNEDKQVMGNVDSAAMLTGKDRAMDIMKNDSNPLHKKYTNGDKDTAVLVSRLLGGN